MIAGSGTLGWDAVACNVLKAGDCAVIVNTGFFGDRFGEWFAWNCHLTHVTAPSCEAYGSRVVHVRSEAVGGVPSISAILGAVKENAPQALIITHVDTSTGVLSDVKTIAQSVREMSPNTLIVVDGVCSVGAEELRMDAWGVDVVLTASQKAIGTPSGLCIMVASPRVMVG